MRIFLVAAALLVACLVVSVGCSSGDSGGGQDAIAEVCGCQADAACTAVASECIPPISCEVDGDCNDGNPCTEDTCMEGVCNIVYVGGAGCCEEDAQCDDGHPCTDDSCMEGMCFYDVPDPLCCTGNGECDDLNICTKGICVEGLCTFEDVAGCCLEPADCNDSNACTSDICVQGKCLHPMDAGVPGCGCSSTGDCDDLNECSLDKCLNGKCEYEMFFSAVDPIPYCCTTASDCDDGDTTTVDSCQLFLCVHTHVQVCKTDSECDDGDMCTKDNCKNGYCEVDKQKVPDCCVNAIQCEDENDCTTDSCVDNKCLHEPNAGLAGCCLDNKDCDDGIECTQDFCASYKCAWQPMSEGCCHFAADCPMPTKPCQKAVCKQGVCQYESELACCVVNSDCNDDDDCTDDKCEAGQCFFWDIASCCTIDVDCDDDNICTIDKCLNGKCQTPDYVDGCCVNAGQCNDQDPCTIDKCHSNKCQYDDKPDCCHFDNECTPELDCEIPHCVNGNCQFELGKDCCYADSDCNDGDPECTDDTCVNNGCVYKLKDEVGCCLEDSDCDALDPCLAVSCKADHSCDYTPVPDCCKEDEECDDGDDLCTLDSCVNNECSYALSDEEGCCLTADDCETPDVCLAPVCTDEHLCELEDVPNCCHTDEECDDGDDLCSDDFCQDDQCHNVYTGAEGCCQVNSDCVSDDTCEAGKCNAAAGTCTFEWIEGCCHKDKECDDGDDVCTTDTCIDEKCVYEGTGADGCCEEFTWLKDFNDSTEQGFTIVNGFSLPIPIPGFDISLGWTISGDCGAHSAPAGLYYGVGAGGMFGSCVYNIDLGIPLPFPNDGTATSPSFTLPEAQDYTLSFYIMPDVSSAANADKLTLSVVDGGTKVPVWDKSDLESGDFGASWVQVDVDLSDYAGKSIKLEWAFDTLGGTGSGGVGVILDDISVTADCNP